MVYIAGDAPQFIKGIEWAMQIRHNPSWSKSVDTYLRDISWDNTWEKMMFRINNVLDLKQRHPKKVKEGVRVAAR